MNSFDEFFFNFKKSNNIYSNETNRKNITAKNVGWISSIYDITNINYCNLSQFHMHE